MDDSPEGIASVGDETEDSLATILSSLDELEREVSYLAIRYAGKKRREFTAKQFGAIRGSLNVLRDKLFAMKSKVYAAKEAAASVAETAMNVADSIEEKKGEEDNANGNVEPGSESTS